MRMFCYIWNRKIKIVLNIKNHSLRKADQIIKQLK